MTIALSILVACGFFVVVARQPITGVVMVVLQSAMLAGIAVSSAIHESELIGASIILATKAAGLTAALTFVLHRSRRYRHIEPHLAPSVRGGIAVVLVVGLVALAPDLHVADALSESATFALIGFGFATVMLRRATLLQIVGVVCVENGVVLAALRAHRPVPFVIELGVALDVLFVAFVAIALHNRIQDELGAGDTELLKTLHD